MTHQEFYELANLTDNPFRTNPVADADPRQGIWVGYPKERLILEKFLKRSLADQVGNVNFVMIYGEYGVGKSHALLWSQYQILHNQAGEFNSAAYYIKTMMKDKAKMSFAIALREDVINKSNIISDVLNFQQFVQERIVEYKHDAGLGPSVTFEEAAAELVPSAELHNLLCEILNCGGAAEVRELLDLTSDHAAMLMFCRLTNLFVLPFGKSGSRFKQGVYLFMDEMDELAQCSAKEAREVNSLIRHIYDQCPNCFFLGLGFTATSAEIGVLFAEYVLSRVTKQVVLEFLQPEEAKQFVAEILNSARVDGARNRGFYPFQEEAVATIVSQIVSITPRKIVNTMQQVLEECRLAGWEPSVGPISSAFLDEHAIWDMVG
jgi:hypothetical protein